MDHNTPNLAIGYTAEFAQSPEEARRRQNNLYLHVVKGSPAGGSFSTVEDLLRFANALSAHKLLNCELTEMVMEEHATRHFPGERIHHHHPLELRQGRSP